MRKQTIGIILGLFSFFSVAAHASIIHVTLNTAALAADAADQPFLLEFELDNGALISSQQNGRPNTPPSNVVTISNFSFGGGHGFNPATDPGYLVDGGGSGSILSTVNLSAIRPGNYLSQGFTPGSTLSFDITYTNNVANSPILDTFDFGIVDSGNNEIPTSGGSIFYSFLQIDFNGIVPTVSNFGSNTTQPTDAGAFLSIAAPAVTNPPSIPEPATFWVMAASLVLLPLGKRLLRNCKTTA